MLFNEPYEIKGKVLRNRYVVAPVKTAYASTEGEVNDRHLRFYENISKDSAGIIIIEPVSVSQSGKEHPKQLNIDKSDSVQNLKKIADIIKKNGSLPAIHLNHAGRGANKMATKTDPVAPSPVMCPMSGLTPKEITKEQIKEIIKAFEKAVKNAVEAGFEAIELQCGHGQLIHQFLSKRLNKRDDEYGQDRTLFLKEVLSVFEGYDDIIKIARISGSEFVDGGWIPRDNEVIFKEIKEAGFDMVHCGFGNSCDTPPWYYSHMALPEDKPLEILKEIKSLTDLPVIAVGRMQNVEKLKKLEDEKLADFVAFGRPIVADNQLISKLVSEKYDEINYCGYCLQGCLYNVKKGVGLGCIVNPFVDKEPLAKIEDKKRVAVIGGGPAGMSAAITLSLVGCEVSLFEKRDALGGNFTVAPMAVGKESMKRPLESMVKRCQREVGDIRLCTDIEKDLSKDYDAYIVANGSVQKYPDIEGLEAQYVVSSLEYFYSDKEMKGDRVLILGAGMVGMEIAENLVSEGFAVTITKRGEEVANDMEPITKKLMLKRLENSSLNIMTKTKILKFENDFVIYEQEGVVQGKMRPFDTVIVATGLKSDDSVERFLKENGISYELIGDAKEVRNIFQAVKEGYEAALRIIY